MTLALHHETRAAAESDLIANGFTLRASGYFGKRSTVDAACGGYPTTALVEIMTRKVTGGPDYFEPRFL